MKDSICSWSSGKDSCIACYKAMKQGYQIKYLLNFVSKEFKRVSFHGIYFDLVKMQAEALNIELVQREVPKGGYEKTFRKAIRFAKSKGISNLIAGDISLLDCRNWIEKVCYKEGLKVVEPLWKIPSEEILLDFINVGFKAVVTATQTDLLDQNWVGRIIDRKFIKDLKKIKGVDLCGERGEYHTFVYDGPIFKRSIQLLKTSKLYKEGYWFLDIKEYKLKEK